MIFKRGDTIGFIVPLTDEEDGSVLILEPSAMRAQIRNGKELIDEFMITATDTPGDYLFRAQGDSTKYPTGTFEMDIEFNIDGWIKSSDTFSIVIKPDVTQ